MLPLFPNFSNPGKFPSEAGRGTIEQASVSRASLFSAQSVPILRKFDNMITGIAHVNLTVPFNTLAEANDFYGATLGLTPRQVPQLQKGRLAWFDIGSSGQQIHIAFGNNDESSRHPCFRIESPEKLLELQKRVWAHHERKDSSAPKAADKPGGESSGTYMFSCQPPKRFAEVMVGFS